MLSLVAHFSTYFGIDPQGRFPAVWLLHFGIFLVYLPLLIFHNKELGGRFGTLDHALIMKLAPKWMKSVCTILSIYTVVNFGLCFVLTEGGTAAIWEENYVLQNKGTLIKELTRDEYDQFLLYEVRGFSGHWMIFYFYSVVGYYSYMNRQEEEIMTE